MSWLNFTALYKGSGLEISHSYFNPRINPAKYYLARPDRDCVLYYISSSPPER
jgi:hypothetical protein